MFSQRLIHVKLIEFSNTTIFKIGLYYYKKIKSNHILHVDLLPLSLWDKWWKNNFRNAESKTFFATWNSGAWIFPFSYLRDQSVNTATDMVLILIFLNFLSSLIINKKCAMLHYLEVRINFLDNHIKIIFQWQEGNWFSLKQ